MTYNAYLIKISSWVRSTDNIAKRSEQLRRAMHNRILNNFIRPTEKSRKKISNGGKSYLDKLELLKDHMRASSGYPRRFK